MKTISECISAYDILLAMISWVQFPALTQFEMLITFGMVSIQPLDGNWVAT